MFSNPLSEYDPAGAPGDSPSGVEPSVALLVWAFDTLAESNSSNITSNDLLVIDSAFRREADSIVLLHQRIEYLSSQP